MADDRRGGNAAWARAGRPGPDSPEVAFVAAQALEPGATDAVLELRRLDDDRVAVMAFGSLETLVDGCGPAQPWVAVPVDRLERLLESYCIALHDRAKLVGVLMLVVVVLFSLVSRGVSWMADWWLWLFVAAPPLLFLTRSRMAAGTD